MHTYQLEATFDVGDMLQSVLAVVAEGLNDLLQVGLQTAKFASTPSMRVTTSVKGWMRCGTTYT